MTPEERDRILRNQERWRQMSPEQREQIRERWRQMPPEERERLRQQRQQQRRGQP
jgi:acyl-CoA reductase-like NAD-dependent aldehyde dehydrogenase